MKNNEPRVNVRAFTMIELLVVIGIIAVLIAITVPAISSVKAASRTGMCLSNLRELGFDTQGFLNNNQGRYFPYAYPASGNALWVTQLRPYGNLDKTRFCPEAPGRTQNVVTLTNGGPMGQDQAGTAHDGWIWDDTTASVQPPSFFNSVADLPVAASTGTYAINGFFYPDAINYGPPSVAVFGRWTAANSGNLAAVPLYADAMWTDTWPDSANTLPTNTPGMATYNTQLGPGINSLGGMDRMVLSRHGRSVNVVFADGHAQNVPLAKLWTLYWHPKYVQPATLPVIPYP